MNLTVLDENATRADIAEALTHCAATARRIPHVIGTPDCPTPWDRLHRWMDERLDDLERAPVA